MTIQGGHVRGRVAGEIDAEFCLGLGRRCVFAVAAGPNESRSDRDEF